MVDCEIYQDSKIIYYYDALDQRSVNFLNIHLISKNDFSNNYLRNYPSKFMSKYSFEFNSNFFPLYFQVQG